jgi:hypothetical protein
VTWTETEFPPNAEDMMMSALLWSEDVFSDAVKVTVARLVELFVSLSVIDIQPELPMRYSTSVRIPEPVLISMVFVRSSRLPVAGTDI